MSLTYYGMDGNALTRDEWIKLMERRDARRVARTRRGKISVSTVLLGLDHGWGGGDPLIFETMIFGGDHDQYQERYSTREQAEEGHKRACELAFEAVA